MKRNIYNDEEDIPRRLRLWVLSFRSVGVQSPTERKRFFESPLLVKSRALKKTIAVFCGLTMAVSSFCSVVPCVYAAGEEDETSIVSQKNDNIESVKPLKDVCKDYFKVGGGVSYNEIIKFGDFIKTHYDSVSMSYELTPENIIDKEKCIANGNNTETQITFNESLDMILNFCQDNGISVRGTCFVWYSMTPSWFFRENFDSVSAYVSPEIMDMRLESFIKKTFKELKEKYPDLKVEAYDVCKELFVNDGGGYRESKNDLRNDWMSVYGDNSYVFNAYRYARKYAPSDCSLFLSDYNEYMPEKCKDICDLAKELKKENLIDGIAMEGYYYTDYTSIDEVTGALIAFKELGLEVQFTELNVSGKDADKKNKVYSEIFRLCMENKDVMSQLTFDYTHDPDDDMWRKYEDPTKGRVFDVNYDPARPYYILCALAEKYSLAAGSDADESLSGDVNSDGVINSSDLLIFADFLLGKNSADYKEALFDMNNDGKASIVDFVILKNIILEN